MGKRRGRRVSAFSGGTAAERESKEVEARSMLSYFVEVENSIRCVWGMENQKQCYVVLMKA